MVITESEHRELMGSVFRELLTEAVQSNRIITSMKNRVVNKIYYDGDETMRPGWRSVEIYCYGTSTGGNDVIRAWQREGVSDTPNGNGQDPLTRKPGWRLFRVDGISSFANTGLKFETDPATLERTRPYYNARDKQMTHIYYAIDSGSTSTQSGDMTSTAGGNKQGGTGNNVPTKVSAPRTFSAPKIAADGTVDTRVQ